jgi:hypothetical protein
LPLKWIEQEEFENLREFQKHEEWPSLMGKPIPICFCLQFYLVNNILSISAGFIKSLIYTKFRSDHP